MIRKLTSSGFGLSFLVFLFSCSKDDDAITTSVTAPTPTADTLHRKDQYIKPYTGIWNGTINDSIAVKQIWQVNPDSTINILEIYENGNSTSSNHTWEGVIHDKDSLIISSIRSVKCFDKWRELIMEIRGRIVKDGNNFTLSTSLDYTTCSDFVHTFNYSLTKK